MHRINKGLQMVTSISSSVSNWADSVFSKLDTKNQGYIQKSDLQSALSAASGNGGHSVNVDDTFSALDADGDGKVTKSEMTQAMTKLSDQLNAQFDSSRAGAGGTSGAGGPGGAGGPHGPHGDRHAGGGGSSTGSTSGASSSSSSSSTNYIAAADTDGNGTVSDAEQAAYDKKVASAEAAKSSSGASGGTENAGHRKDPTRELAHALNLLKAYAENSGSSDASASSTTSSTATNSVSVEAVA
jgi:hypothetical protein